MKIFTTDEGSSYQKINFVDANNVFVGYDNDQICCEDFGWYITETQIPYDYKSSISKELSSKNPPDVSDYEFDKNYFMEIKSSELEDGAMVVFKLKANGRSDLYLHLYNCQNGYYGHGFDMKHGGETVRNGNL